MVIHTRLRLIIQQGFKSDKHKYVSMRKILSTAAISMSVFISCTTTRVSDTKGKHTDDPIEVAIADYAKTSKQFKKEKVFVVTRYDTLYKIELVKSDSQVYKWVRGQIYDRILAVNIISGNKQFSAKMCPTHALEIRGKLFYWWEEGVAPTSETMNLLSKYNLIQTDIDSRTSLPERLTDDSQKGADYFFCRNNIYKYKVVNTTKAIGYYEPPYVGCDNKE